MHQNLNDRAKLELKKIEKTIQQSSNQNEMRIRLGHAHAERRAKVEAGQNEDDLSRLRRVSGESIMFALKLEPS